MNTLTSYSKPISTNDFVVLKATNNTNINIVNNVVRFSDGTFIRNLTQDEITAITTVETLYSNIVDSVSSVTLERVIYQNHDQNIISIDADGTNTIVLVSQLSIERQTLVSQFNTLIHAIFPNAIKVEWLQGGKMLVDGVEAPTSELSESQALIIFEIGEINKGKRIFWNWDTLQSER